MRVHIVQKGDTLWKIAKQYSIGFEDLKRLNAHLANPDYIVPGMEIILPEGGTKKEKEVMHQAVVKEQEKKPIVKEKPITPTPPPTPTPPTKPTPPPTPTPIPVPLPVPPRPLWQGDIYFQPPAVPVQIPNWQNTHVHFQPTIETPMMPLPQPQPALPPTTPAPLPLPTPTLPTPQPQPVPPPTTPAPLPLPTPTLPSEPIMPQPPIYIQPPMPQNCMPMMPHHCMPQWMPPMHHNCMPPMMQPMPICPNCHGIRMEGPPAFMPMYQEESSMARMEHHHDRDHQVRHYHEEMPNSCGCHHQPPMPLPMPMPNSCGCHHQPMMPYPMPYPMPMPMMPQMHPQMNPMPHPPKSCH